MAFKTRITELLGIDYPIIQGGLAYLAYAELAAAVSNAGGLGQITAMSLPGPDELRKEIHKVRELTDRPFGVNFAIGDHGRSFSHMLDVAIEENVPVVSMTGGNPTPIFEQLEGTSIKKLVLVAARRQAEKAEQLGADAVMVVGHEGGGHLGRDDIGTMVLIPQVVDAVSIPVIAFFLQAFFDDCCHLLFKASKDIWRTFKNRHFRTHVRISSSKLSSDVTAADDDKFFRNFFQSKSTC